MRDFTEETAIIPEIVADVVLSELAPESSEEDRAWFREHVHSRTVHLYEVNTRWRKMMRAANGRDELYIFVRHWLKAFLLDTQKYRERHPPIG